MRWQALILGGAGAALPMVVFGCGLVAPLDGLTGNQDGAVVGVGGDDTGLGSDGGSSETGPATDATAGGDAGLDASASDAEAAVPDSGGTGGDAPFGDGPLDGADEPPPVAPIAFVQIAASSPSGFVASVTAKFALAQIAGDLNVVAIGWNDATSSVSQVTDSSGNTYALAIAPTVVGSDISQTIYYAKNISAAAAGANSVTVTFVEPANVPDLRILEYSGLDPANPLDATASGSGNSAGPATTPAASTKTARELLFAAGMTTDLYSAAGSGFTMRLVSNDGDMVEDRTVSATGSYSGSASLGASCEWIVQLATFR
jgi:hypothetical protein